MKRLLLLLLLSVGLLHADIVKLEYKAINDGFLRIEHDSWKNSSYVFTEGIIFNDVREGNEFIYNTLKQLPKDFVFVAAIRYDFYIIELYGSVYSVNIDNLGNTTLSYMGEEIPEGLR